MRFERELSLFLSLTTFFIVQSASAQTEQRKSLKIDREKSSIQFTAQAVGYEVLGELEQYNASLEVNPENIEDLKVQVEVDMASVNTSDDFGAEIREFRNTHLRSQDFFDAATFPTAKFQSLKVQKDASGNYSLRGRLIMKGIPNNVTLAITSLEKTTDTGKVRFKLVAETTIDRRDFGINWSGDTSPEALAANQNLLANVTDLSQISGKLLLGVTSNDVKVIVHLEAYEE